MIFLLSVSYIKKCVSFCCMGVFNTVRIGWDCLFVMFHTNCVYILMYNLMVAVEEACMHFLLEPLSPSTYPFTFPSPHPIHFRLYDVHSGEMVWSYDDHEGSSTRLWRMEGRVPAVGLWTEDGLWVIRVSVRQTWPDTYS